MSDIRLRVAARTDVGKVRKNNEDAFTVADLDDDGLLDRSGKPKDFDVGRRGVLLVVSDGMGGHAAGEVASALVVDSLRASLGQEADVESMEGLIDEAVKQANADVFEAAKKRAREGMGATLTAVLINEGIAYIAEVGDSRAYVYRQGRLRQMTKDQSFVQILVDSGAITSEQAKNFTQKNWIVQAMGLEPDVEVSIGKLRLRRGDRLLLCSDGLHNELEDRELAEILAGDLDAACDRLIELANERGGGDNITAIVAEATGDGLPNPFQQESVTQTFEVIKEFAGLDLVDPSRRRSSKPPPRDEEPEDDILPVGLASEDSSSAGAKDEDDEPPADPAAVQAAEPAIRRDSAEAPPVSQPKSDEDDSRTTTLWMLGVAALVLLLVAIGYWFMPGR